MKRRIAAACLCLAAVLLLCGPHLSAGAAVLYTYPQEDELTAPSAMLVYLGVLPEQDVILYEKNADVAYQTGALLRVAVGVYAMQCIEQQGLDMDAVTGAYSKTLFNHYVTGTGLGTASMAFGEEWTLRDLLAVCMVQTAADAAVTLAQTLSGSVEAFVEGMNRMIGQAGCTHTTFTNVTGEDDPRSVQSARDLYQLMRLAADDPVLRDMMSQPYVTVHPVKGGDTRGWENTNALLRSTSDYYYSKARYGRCGTGGDDYLQNVAVVAADGGYEYLAIIMGLPRGETSEYFIQAKQLLQWGFSAFSYKTLLNKNEVIAKMPVSLAWETDTVALVALNEVASVVANEIESDMVRRQVTLYQPDIAAPVTKGQVLGKVELFLNEDRKIGESELVAGQSLEKSTLLDLWENKVLKILTSQWTWMAVGLVLLLIAGYILPNLWYNRSRRRRKVNKRFRL